MRIVVGISGASGAPYALDFLMKCSAAETFVIVTRWGRSLLKTEADVSLEQLSAYAKKIYSTDDLSAPFASGSNAFDALVIVPCSVASLGKIANGISDTLLTRTAEVALKENRKMVLCVRETPWSAVALENALKLSRLGVTIMPVSPPFYHAPKTLDELVAGFTDKIMGVLGMPVSAGWRSDELE